MGCTIAMAVLGICTFTLDGEPASPHFMRGERWNSALAQVDSYAMGRMDSYGRPVFADEGVIVGRRGRVYVRPRGDGTR
jgi:hypothetical protein